MAARCARRDELRRYRTLSPTPLDIVHVVVPAMSGGLERVVEMLSAGQVRAGHRVAVIAVVYAGDPRPPLLSKLANAGVEVMLVETRGRAYGAERAAVKRALQTRRRGIVHTHGYRADVLHLATARALGHAVVSTLHGFTGGDWKNRLYERLQRRAVRRAHRVVAVSRAIGDRMSASGVPSSRVRILQNAFAATATIASRAEARAQLALGEFDWVVGFVGRLSAEKGPDVLLEALAQLQDLPIRSVYIGDGRDESALRERSRKLGLSDRVRWAGAVDDAGALFRAFDLFALSSRTEGTPIALFEAMSAGTPVVASAVGGVGDVVGVGEAWLVPAEDPKALAAAIREAFTDATAGARRAAAAAGRLATGFSAERWVEGYDAVYREALEVEAAKARSRDEPT